MTTLTSVRWLVVHKQTHPEHMNIQTIIGFLHIIGVLVLSILILAGLIPMWRSFLAKAEKAEEDDTEDPSLKKPVIITVVVVGVSIIGLCYGCWKIVEGMIAN